MNKAAIKDVLTLAFAVLWIADAAFTAEFVQEQGLHMEANPIVAWVIATYSITTFIWIKVVLLAAWFLLQKHIHTTVHVVLIAILLPVVYMGFAVATSV